jgi:hypothetical protein
MLVVVGERVQIVDNRIRRELWFGGILTLVAFFGTGLERGGGPVAGGTHDVGVQLVAGLVHCVACPVNSVFDGDMELLQSAGPS